MFLNLHVGGSRGQRPELGVPDRLPLAGGQNTGVNTEVPVPLVLVVLSTTVAPLATTIVP